MDCQGFPISFALALVGFACLQVAVHCLNCFEASNKKCIIRECDFFFFFLKLHQCQKADIQRNELLLWQHAPLLSSILIFLATDVFKMSSE